MDIYSNIKQQVKSINYNSYSPNYDNSNITKLIDIINNKKTKYCFDVKFESIEQIIELINFYKNHICVLKIYSSIIKDFTYKEGLQLKAMAIEYNFLLMDGMIFDYNSELFFTQYIKNKIYLWGDLINLSNMHDNNIYKIIDEINIKMSSNISIIYSNYDTNNTILNTINTYKNIIGLYNYNIDCNIIVFDELKSKNDNANIIILNNENYIYNNKFISFNQIKK